MDEDGGSWRVEDSEIEKFAHEEPTPFQMEEILAMKDPQGVLGILQREIPVRLANRIAHMDDLSDISQIEPLVCARARLAKSFREVRAAAARGSCPEDFAQVVNGLKIRHKDQIKRVAVGMAKVKELKLARGENEAEVVKFIDNFLNRFCLSRIGIEMLNSQYLALFTKSRGIVDRQCDPCEVARLAAATARKFAQAEFDMVPEAQISFHGLDSARTIPLVPSYLMYILLELLKNSFRAVCDLNKKTGGDMRHPILIRVCSDEAQVAIDIFDRGGGIPFEHQTHIWNFMYSTKKGSEPIDTLTETSENTTASPLAGFGVGLPLARLYAEYIGGSLHLMSMPNFGTHAFLHLQRCSSRKEGMPTYVNWLRKRRLLEQLLDLETKKRAAADSEDYAEALRLKGKAAEVREEVAKLERFEKEAWT